MSYRPAAVLALALFALPGAAPSPTELPQGWTTAEREIWWNSPQGSRIIPYAWFGKLEQAGGKALFVEPGHMAGYGYIAAPVSAVNPDGLPIGFSRERDRADGLWLGMTCAACHVGTVSRGGKSVLIEGGGAQVDTSTFDRELSAALAATLADEAKFGRFADRLDATGDARTALHARLATVTAERVEFTAMNTPPHAYGPGRVDALGVIMNALASTALELPGNARAPDAPVRLPWVWNSSTYSRAQYNGSISNAGLGPVLRNIGQTLGVYGTVDVSKAGLGYPSSVSVADLEKLEALLRKLEPPAWPVDVLGPIDAGLAERGAAVFQQACAGCHAVKDKDAAGLDPVTIVPLDRLGTDPLAARNFMTRPAATGVLEGRPVGVFGGAVFGARAGAATIVGHVSTAVAATGVPRERLQSGLTAYRASIAASPSRLDAYKAIPLAGVWAGAPYLHNGSVANLRQLLMAPGDRAASFTVGGRDYDPAVVGYPADTSVPGFKLDTALPGNSNAGHDYGTTLPEEEKSSLLEYLKTL